MSELGKIIETLQELERMHQLNLELLEQYDIFLTWIIETNLPIPNKERITSLLSRTKALLQELYCGRSPKVLLYKKLADESLHEHKTDGDLTEP